MDVAATAVAPGAQWNGLGPGAITDILDPVSFVASATNIADVTGGTDVEDQERFRLRVVNALFTIAKTGPKNGYREHVLAVDPEIADVGVIRPTPGRIDIYPLMCDGLPTQGLKDAVAAYLDPEVLRPMGDDVFVLSPTRVDFTFTLTVRCLEAVAGLAAAAEEADRAAFFGWTQELGAQIAPSVIVAAVKAVAGVTDVSIAGLVFTDLAEHEFAAIDVLTVNIVVSANA